MRTDSPIKKKKDDLLDRYDFAKDIVKGLLNSFVTGQDSISIGLNGEWGSGKSSILEFIETEIKSQTKKEQTSNIIFRFNPWIFSGQTDLQKSFLTQLGIYLRTLNPELKKLGGDIVLISTIAEIANILNPELLSQKIIGSGTKILKKIGEKIGNEPSLQKLKNKIDDVLESSSIKVFIFIDDIDRLIADEIADIFRLVKLNANFKNTFFFLAYDKLVVTKAISSTCYVDGNQFIEKIIQLDYTLPKLSPEILENLFVENLKNLANSEGITFSKEELGTVWKNGLNEYFSNLRHIYRYFNALEVRYPGIKNEVNYIDFSAIEAIRIFDYQVYEWIYHHREDFFPNEILFPIGIEGEKEKSIIENLESATDLKIKENTKQIVNTIFNTIHYDNYSGFVKDKIDLSKLEKEKRISHKDYFDHYFSFKVSANNIPQTIIDKFLNTEIELKTQILKEYKNTRLTLFLRRTIYSIPDDFKQIRELQKFILDFADKEELHLLHEGIFNYNGLTTVISFLNDVCKRFGYIEYIEEILSSIQSYSRFFLQGFLRNKINGSSNIEPVNTIPSKIITEYETRILKKFDESLIYFSHEYLSNPFGNPIFVIRNIFLLLYEEKIEVYKKRLEEYLSDKEKAIILFRCSVTIATGFGREGEFYSIQNDKYILPELTIEKLDSILGKGKFDDFKGKNKEYLAVFLKLKERNFNPNYFYSVDLKEQIV